jgi:hypothetical protein
MSWIIVALLMSPSGGAQAVQTSALYDTHIDCLFAVKHMVEEQKTLYLKHQPGLIIPQYACVPATVTSKGAKKP